MQDAMLYEQVSARARAALERLKARVARRPGRWRRRMRELPLPLEGAIGPRPSTALPAAA